MDVHLKLCAVCALLLVGCELDDVSRAPAVAKPATTTTTTTRAASTAAASIAATLEFRYGGVKANPAVDSRCKISKLSIGRDSLSFRWDSGIPSDWKKGDTGKGPMVLACAFYLDGDKWIGGKFDWIDTARNTRPLENIRTGYGGWNAAAWDAAKKRAFCVMSADGRFRSNLLED